MRWFNFTAVLRIHQRRLSDYQRDEAPTLDFALVAVVS
jgi:hypothetical protein